MRRILWLVLAILTGTATVHAQTTLYFPQVVDGRSGNTLWSTIFVVTNPAAANTATASGAITLTQSDGSKFTPTVMDLSGNPAGFGNTIPFQLSGGQTMIVTTSGQPALVAGFATLTSTGTVLADAVFQEISCSSTANTQTGDGCVQVGEALVPSVTPLTRQAVVVAKLSQTGVAIANPTNSTASVTLALYDLNGLPSGTSSFTLPPNNQVAKFAGQLFAGLNDPFYGTMQVLTMVPASLVVTPLYFPGNGPFFTGTVIPLN